MPLSPFLNQKTICGIQWIQFVDLTTGEISRIHSGTGERKKTRTGNTPAASAELKSVLEDLKEITLKDIGHRLDIGIHNDRIEWGDAGQKEDLLIWRVENRRSELGTPEFGVKPWPKDRYGEFYKGDSYIVMNTFLKPGSQKKLMHDIHYWIGCDSTIDEYAVAAYKTVELDDNLGGLPVQHREVIGMESDLFRSYFPSIKYLDGGIDGGLVPAGTRELNLRPQLLRVRKENGEKTISFEVPCKASSLNQGDAFVLDAGRKVYVWFGVSANPFERAGAGTLQNTLVARRLGKAVKVMEADEEFWTILQGTPEDVQPEDADFPLSESQNYAEGSSSDSLGSTEPPKVIWRLTDSSGELKMTKQRSMFAPCKLLPEDLDSDDVLIIDTGDHVYAWVGSRASPDERRTALLFAAYYLQVTGRALCPCSRVVEGQHNAGFDRLLNPLLLNQ